MESRLTRVDTEGLTPLPGQFFRFSFSSGGCETPLGFGVIPISLPGVRRNAATPGIVVKPFQG